MANQYPTKSVTTDSSGTISTTTFTYGSPVVAKTASYQVKASDSGTIFTTRGAGGAVTFTLPTLQSDISFRFVAAAAQSMVVTSTAANIKGSFTAGGSAAAAGAAISGTSLTCAAGTAANQWTVINLECDGTNWLVSNIQGGGITVA